MSHVPDPMPAHQRRHLLSHALSAVSTRMASLRKSSVLTDDLLHAMRSPSSMYVPGYVFSFVADAEDCEGYDETIRDRRAAVDKAAKRIRAAVGHVRPQSLEELRAALALPASDTGEFVVESRCVHMRRMLELGMGILVEAWSNRCDEEDTALRSLVAETIVRTTPHPRYGSSKDAEEWAFRLLCRAVAHPEQCAEHAAAA